MGVAWVVDTIEDVVIAVEVKEEEMSDELVTGTATTRLPYRERNENTIEYFISSASTYVFVCYEIWCVMIFSTVEVISECKRDGMKY